MMPSRISQPALLAIERLAFSIPQTTSCIRVLDRALAARAPDAHETRHAKDKLHKALERDLLQLALVLTQRE